MKEVRERRQNRKRPGWQWRVIPEHLDCAGVEVSEKISSYTNVLNSNWIETHQSRARGVARVSQRPFGAAANQQQRRRSWGVIGPGPQALLALDILNLMCPMGEIRGRLLRPRGEGSPWPES